MPHTFNSNDFEALAADAERLAVRAVEHERRLSLLVDALETDQENELAGIIRELCVEAREQRGIADALRGRLLGDIPSANGDGGRRPLVLIVDDSPDNREMAAMVLDTCGFETITAANGLEGLIVAHYAMPAVVIMDVAMPVLDGLEAARVLKASQATRAIPVIAYTARVKSDDTRFKDVFAGVLQKPAPPEDIVGLVQRLAVPGEPEVA